MLVFPEENKTGAARAGAHLQVKTKGRGALNLWKVGWFCSNGGRAKNSP